ncbi:MAG: hypothetical protein CMB77_02350 [Euryarchaeota archaeon]|nr:hypothetical protein [Euryarchaeota archaeon]|tara:strand:- start:2993 stop:3466 length:474 start_codon:yes stop_codon:yes gene_type:complete
MIETPNFQGTHLWERLCWAKENLEPVKSDIRIVYEDPNDMESPAKILSPDPNWLACAIQGGILPPVEVYWELEKDESQPDFVKHTRGYLLHDTKPIEAMTIKAAIDYLIMKDVPQRIWRTWDEGNKPKMVICRLHQLPKHRKWRNAWQIKDDIKLVA